MNLQFWFVLEPTPPPPTNPTTPPIVQSVGAQPTKSSASRMSISPIAKLVITAILIAIRLCEVFS